jgi:hypothetical protein
MSLICPYMVSKEVLNVLSFMSLYALYGSKEVFNVLSFMSLNAFYGSKRP